MSERTDELLRELHREVVDARNATIKTDNSLKSLAGEIKIIARRQEDYERRIIINSVGAYVLFATIAFLGLLLFFRAALLRYRADEERFAAETASVERRVSEIEGELERRRQSEREAYEFFELLASGRRDEVVERFPTVQGRLIDRATIELFRREVDRIEQELADEAWQSGLQHVQNEQWADARDAFTRSLAFVENPPYAPSLHFQLAEALYSLNDYASASRYYQLSLDSGQLGRTDQITAMYHRAESLQRSERDNEALEAWRQFNRRFSEHPWAPTARQRIERLESQLREVANSDGAAPVAPAAPATP
jgi:TolA-binding protein